MHIESILTTGEGDRSRGKRRNRAPLFFLHREKEKEIDARKKARNGGSEKKIKSRMAEVGYCFARTSRDGKNEGNGILRRLRLSEESCDVHGH